MAMANPMPWVEPETRAVLSVLATKVIANCHLGNQNPEMP
jgi:hypothetical protein